MYIKWCIPKFPVYVPTTCRGRRVDGGNFTLVIKKYICYKMLQVIKSSEYEGFENRIDHSYFKTWLSNCLKIYFTDRS